MVFGIFTNPTKCNTDIRLPLLQRLSNKNCSPKFQKATMFLVTTMFFSGILLPGASYGQKANQSCISDVDIMSLNSNSLSMPACTNFGNVQIEILTGKIVTPTNHPSLADNPFFVIKQILSTHMFYLNMNLDLLNIHEIDSLLFVELLFDPYQNEQEYFRTILYKNAIIFLVNQLLDDEKSILNSAFGDKLKEVLYLNGYNIDRRLNGEEFVVCFVMLDIPTLEIAQTINVVQQENCQTMMSKSDD